MVRHLVVVGLTVWVLGAATPLVAQTEAGLDQYQLDGTHNGAVHSANALGQSFTVGKNGILSAVEVALMPWFDPSAPLEVEIRDVSGGVPGTIIDDSVTLWPDDLGPFPASLGAQEVTATLIRLEDLEIAVSVGDQLGILLTTAEVMPSGYSVRFAGEGSYADGQMFTPFGPNDGADLVFKTFVAVPLFDDGFETGDTDAWSTSVP